MPIDSVTRNRRPLSQVTPRRVVNAGYWQHSSGSLMRARGGWCHLLRDALSQS
jgi:hypothetical protein